MELLKLENVKFAYKNTAVIEDFNLSVDEGSFTTLLGSSGCGKTTILRLISGFLNPDSGTIKINGEIQKTQSRNGLSRLCAFSSSYS